MPEVSLDDIISLCKRRGFVYPGSEIYGGEAGLYDFGPYGVELLNNIKKSWWRRNVYLKENYVGLDSAMFKNPRVWEASGHVGGFSDPLADAYKVEQLPNGESRTVLKLKPELAPVQYAVFPLLKNKPELVAKAREVYEQLSKKFVCEWDDNGNIGKRYRRQDEIGTPACIVVDFQTLEDGTVTVRDRDTTEQRRVKIEGL